MKKTILDDVLLSVTVLLWLTIAGILVILVDELLQAAA